MPADTDSALLLQHLKSVTCDDSFIAVAGESNAITVGVPNVDAEPLNNNDFLYEIYDDEFTVRFVITGGNGTIKILKYMRFSPLSAVS